MSLSWDDLRYFLAVAHTGTLAGAARALAVNQSTVGRRLMALESAVGARLFERTPDGYLPTSAAHAVLEQVRGVEAAVFSVERRLSAEDQRAEGVVRVTTSETFATYFVVPRLDGLHERHLEVSVELNAANLPLDLARREADLALRLIARPTQPALIARKLGELAFGLYAAERYLKGRGKSDDFIGYAPELSSVPGAPWIADQARSGRVVFSANSIPALAAATRAGLGMAVLPCFIGDPLENVRRLEVDLVERREIWMMIHPDVQRQARVRAVAEYLAEVVRRDADALLGVSRSSGRASRPSRRR